MFKRFKNNKSIYLLLWLSAICGYLAIVVVTGYSFDWVIFFAISNMALLPSLFDGSAYQERKIDEPQDYVTFKQGNMYIGDAVLPIANVRKVALERVEQDAYFSLPYNHVKSGDIPNMIFSANKIQAFEQYLKANLASDVVFIK